MIYWQNYERTSTGEMFRFRRLSPGRYLREDGVEFTMNKMARYYQWKSGDRAPRHEYKISPNGFKIRITKNMRSKDGL